MELHWVSVDVSLLTSNSISLLFFSRASCHCSRGFGQVVRPSAFCASTPALWDGRCMTALQTIKGPRFEPKPNSEWGDFYWVKIFPVTSHTAMVTNISIAGSCHGPSRLEIACISFCRRTSQLMQTISRWSVHGESHPITGEARLNIRQKGS